MILFFIMSFFRGWAQSSYTIGWNPNQPSMPIVSLQQNVFKESDSKHLEIWLSPYKQERDLWGFSYIPRVTSLYWERVTKTKKTSIGLQPVDWGLGLYRQSRKPWFGFHSLEDRQIRLLHGGFLDTKQLFWWTSVGSQYQSSRFLHYPLLDQKLYPLANVGLFQRGFLGEWGFFFEWEQEPQSTWYMPLNSYVSIRILPELSLKNENLFVVSSEQSLLQYHRAHMWQLEYQIEGQGLRLEMAMFPEQGVAIHANQQIFIVPTPSSQYWKTSLVLTQPTADGYFRFVMQTQSGDWLLRIGSAWMHETQDPSRIWNPIQKSREFVLRIGKHQNLGRQEHHLRFICDTGFHMENNQNYWMFMPQIEYQIADSKKQERAPSTTPPSF